MNSVNLIGRLTRDPEVRYSNDLAIGRFTIAINRMPSKNGEDRGADFINIVAFGKRAEVIEKYFHKGSQIGIQGRFQTGSYEKDGVKRYTTDIVLENFDFLDKRTETQSEESYAGFEELNDDDIPF